MRIFFARLLIQSHCTNGDKFIWGTQDHYGGNAATMIHARIPLASFHELDAERHGRIISYN